MRRKLQSIFILILVCLTKQLNAQDYKAISDSFYYAGKLDSALRYAAKAELKIIDNLGKKSHEYAEFVGQYYGLIYSGINNIDSALYWHRYSIHLLEQLNDTTSQVYGSEIGNYGSLLNTYVSYTEAFPYLQKAFTILEKHKEVIEDYLGSMNNLATYYNYVGEYSNAESQFKKCLGEVQKNPMLFDPTRSGVLFHNLGNVYLKTGNYALAEISLIKARNVPKTSSEGKYVYVLSTKDLADLYVHTKNYEKAGKLYNELLADSVFQPESINNPRSCCTSLYPDIINGSGNLKEAQKQYKAAENLYKKSILAAKGSTLPLLYKFSDLFFLAQLYTNRTRYVEADSLYTILFTKIDSNLRKDRFFYTRLFVSYCENLIKMGQMQKAAEKTKYITQLFLQDTHTNFPGMTEEEQMKYVHSLGNYLNLAFSAFIASTSKKNESIKFALNQLLQLKGMIINYQARRLQSLRISSDTALNMLNKNWLSLKEKLYKKYAGSSNIKINTDSLNSAIEDLDEQISLKTGTATDNINDKLSDDISSKLKQNEVALEYIHYKKIQTGVNVYGVFIMRFGKEPEYVQLCTEKQLKDCLKENNTISIQSQIVNNSAVYNLIWKPIQPLLVNAKVIYYSPDGLLNYFSFDIIKTGQDSYLLNDKKMVLLTSTRNLLNITFNENKLAAAVLWGQIDCSEEAYLTNNNATINKKIDTKNISLPDGVKGSSHNYFAAWDDEELSAITAIAKQNKLPIKVFAKENATEENFKKNAASFTGILHISSHGFYSNQPSENVNNGNGLNPFNSQINPLLRCGLVLNGGNYVWGGKKPLPDKEDGILTGYEIALMDLSKVDLVVLSACETGLGDIDPGSEGVLGLQRAFKLAGVKKMVLTLWEVSVKDTKIFMTNFYKQLLGGLNASNALRNTKILMAKQYPPLAWAGFVLIE